MSTVITAGNATNGLSLTADNAGAFEFKTGTGAGTTALTLSSAQVATFAGNVVFSGNVSGVIKSGTAVASTSGTSIDFTGIPSGVKRITVMLSGVSTNGTSNLIFQLGDSGGVETTGYTNFSGTTGASAVAGAAGGGTGIQVNLASASATFIGHIVFTLISGTTWVCSGMLYGLSTNIYYVAGNKTLSDVLDRVRVTTVNGTDTFDAGTINIFYEQSKSCTE